MLLVVKRAMDLNSKSTLNVWNVIWLDIGPGKY
jgi:hypothetical protein